MGRGRSHPAHGRRQTENKIGGNHVPSPAAPEGITINRNSPQTGNAALLARFHHYSLGDLAEKFYIIVQGFVEVVQERSDSEPVVVAKLGRNDYFGEIGLMPEIRRTATVPVPPDSQAQVIAIDGESFLKMVSDSEVTYAAISHRLCQRLISDLNRF